MLDELLALASDLALRRDIRAAILFGDGPSFCTGRDTRVFGGGDNAGLRATASWRGQEIRRTQAMIWSWRDLPFPLICAVQGHAIGGGLQLAAAADIRFATPDSKWAMLEVKWGLLPDMGALDILRRLLRDDVLRYLALSGRPVSGTEAAGLGLVTRACEDPLAEARTFAMEVAKLSPTAVRAGKSILNEFVLGDPSAALARETELRGNLAGSPNQAEAVRARREKRAPAFHDPE